MGSPDFASPTLRLLLEKMPTHIVGVVTQPDRPKGRGKQPSPTPVKALANTHELPVFTPSSTSDIFPLLSTLTPDLVVVIAYGLILPKIVTESFRCINLHASLLPEYRGASPIQAALLNGDDETGVTLIHMNEKMDEGNILLMGAVPLTGAETFGHLHDVLSEVSASLLGQFLDMDTFPQGIPQDHDSASYCRKITRDDCRLMLDDDEEDWYRVIKAMSPTPGAFIELDNRKIVKLLNADWTTDGVCLTRVKPQGKGEMSYHDYLLANPPII